MKFPKKIARRQVTCSLTPGCKTQDFHTQLALPSVHLSQHTSAHTHSFPTSAPVVSCSALPFCVQGSPASPWAPSGPPAPCPPNPGSPWAPPSLSALCSRTPPPQESSRTTPRLCPWLSFPPGSPDCASPPGGNSFPLLSPSSPLFCLLLLFRVTAFLKLHWENKQTYSSYRLLTTCLALYFSQFHFIPPPPSLLIQNILEHLLTQKLSL